MYQSFCLCNLWHAFVDATHVCARTCIRSRRARARAEHRKNRCCKHSRTNPPESISLCFPPSDPSTASPSSFDPPLTPLSLPRASSHLSAPLRAFSNQIVPPFPATVLPLHRFHDSRNQFLRPFVPSRPLPPLPPSRVHVATLRHFHGWHGRLSGYFSEGERNVYLCVKTIPEKFHTAIKKFALSIQ